MARPLEHIWLRFGLTMMAAVLITLAVFAAGLLLEEYLEQQYLVATLPVDTLNSLQALEADSRADSQQIQSLYRQLGPGEGHGIAIKILLGLLLSMIIGGIAAQLSARTFLRPLDSLTETALRISQGDLSVRAEPPADTGEIHKLVENFNLMAGSLERLEYERREMVAAISHELRTPLTILQGRLHALCDGVIPGNLAEHYKLLEYTEHLVRLVEDLNTVTLAAARQLTLHLSHFDLAGFVAELIPVYEDRAAKHGVLIHVDAGAPVLVHADQDRIQQVLGNLIENAIRYAAGGERIDVTVLQRGDKAILDISDYGPGLPETLRERIFDPFFRFDDSRSRETGGSGLGLSVVKSIIEQHGGTIDAGHRQGGGACFTISLPLATEPETHHPET